jgi:hypothetical protein
MVDSLLNPLLCYVAAHSEEEIAELRRIPHYGFFDWLPKLDASSAAVRPVASAGALAPPPARRPAAAQRVVRSSPADA